MDLVMRMSARELDDEQEQRKHARRQGQEEAEVARLELMGTRANAQELKV
jgi:hypothetical protein